MVTTKMRLKKSSQTILSITICILSSPKMLIQALALPSCNVECDTCTADPAHCLTCDYGAPGVNYFVPSTNKCLGSCPAATYPQTGLPGPNTAQCPDCHSTCETCSAAGDTSCDSCDTATYYYIPSTKRCVPHSPGCPSGFYLASSQCLPCPAGKGCSECVQDGADARCTACPGAGEVIENKVCKSGCSTGYFQSGINCNLCTAPCSTCSGMATTCTSCTGNLVLSGSQCLQRCPDGTYKDASNVCRPCSASCLTCGTSADRCLSCRSTAFLNSTNGCQMKCSENEAWVHPNSCEACQGCSKCENVTKLCIRSYSYSLLPNEEFYEDSDISLPLVLIDASNQEVLDQRITHNTGLVNKQSISATFVSQGTTITSGLVWRDKKSRYDLALNLTNQLKTGDYVVKSTPIATLLTKPPEYKVELTPWTASSELKVNYEGNPLKDESVLKNRKTAQSRGEAAEALIEVGSAGSEVLGVVGILGGFEALSPFMQFAQASKLLARMSLAKIDYGVTLGEFLRLASRSFNDYEDSSDEGSTKTLRILEENRILRREKNSKNREKIRNKERRILHKFTSYGEKDSENETNGKLSQEKVILFITQKTINLLKMIAYGLSCIAKYILLFLFQRMISGRTIQVWLIKALRIHRKIHLSIFNMILIDLIYFGTRGLFNAQLNDKTAPPLSYILFCYIFILFDLMEVFLNVWLIMKRSRAQEGNKQSKIDQEGEIGAVDKLESLKNSNSATMFSPEKNGVRGSSESLEQFNQQEKSQIEVRETNWKKGAYSVLPRTRKRGRARMSGTCQMITTKFQKTAQGCRWRRNLVI